MIYKILVVLAFFSLLTSCSDEKVEPEFPTISKAELDNFLSRETISLNFTSTYWSFSTGNMQAYGSNCFINCPVKDTIALGSGLVNPDGRYFSLNAGVVPYNDDVDILTKHFSIGDKTVRTCCDGYNVLINDPTRPNSTIELLRIKVVKASLNTQLYWNYERKIKVWFLMDFNIRDSSGTKVEKIRNAKYINEFFLIDFSREHLNSGRIRYDKISTP
jgi:hypothetical protein